MKKHWREICFILPSIVAAVAAVVGIRTNVPVFPAITYPAEEITAKAKESPVPEEERKENTLSENRESSKKKIKKVSYTENNNTWKDGTYTGSGTGFGGVITVRITIENSKIKAIQLLSCQGETPSYLKQAKGVISRMIAAQSPDVDMVSGATYSSNGIRSAVIQALNKAGAKLSAEPQKAPVNKDKKTKSKQKALPATKKHPSGTVKDGVYTVSERCEPDERKAFAAYSLTADVTFKGGKCTSIAKFSATDESNKNYYLKAANGMVKGTGVVAQILKRQSASGINAVSGATCSSVTIQKLYLKALRKATVKSKPVYAEESFCVLTPSPSPSPSPLPTQTPNPYFSLLPTESNVTIKDGTYTASAMVVADEWEEFADYNLTADVTFYGGKLTAITNLVPEDITNQSYCNLAANGYGTKTGVIRQLLDKQSGDVDAVSGATCSSMALIQIYKNALEMATKQEQE